MLLIKDKGGYFIITFGAILAIVWLIWGYSIFFDPLSFDYKWARGELGDFVGGGLGGITVVFIIYTVWLQIGQINSQKNESFEAAYDFAKIFNDLNNLNQEASGKYHIKRIKDFIKSEMDEYYESSEIPKPDTIDFYDAIDEVWEIVDKQKKERLQQSQQQQ